MSTARNGIQIAAPAPADDRAEMLADARASMLRSLAGSAFHALLYGVLTLLLIHCVQHGWSHWWLMLAGTFAGIALASLLDALTESASVIRVHLELRREAGPR